MIAILALNIIVCYTIYSPYTCGNISNDDNKKLPEHVFYKKKCRFLSVSYSFSSCCDINGEPERVNGFAFFL